MKIALLSNVNIESIAKRFSKKIDVYTSSGYGIVMEELMDPQSSLWSGENHTIFIYIDIWELTAYGENLNVIDKWFNDFRYCIHTDCTYFISNVDWRGGDISGYHGISKPHLIEHQWDNKLCKLCNEFNHCHVFNYKSLIEEHGRNYIYSNKMWLLGKIPFSAAGEKAIVNEIELMIQLLSTSPKKVLVLDLDNTLWGGISGEDGISGILLGREGKGASYFYFQTALKKIKNTGALLCISSKNNIECVREVFEKHPDIPLKLEDFTVVKANWEPKSQNIIDIAKELNLSTDSFVFVDDNPVERGEVALNVPGITVPEFPDDITSFTSFAESIYRNYFSKLQVTSEDLAKAENYAAEFKRKENQKSFDDFNGFLRSLNIKVELVDNHKDYISRIHQLICKTNQFNLTTLRLSLPALHRMLVDNTFQFYLFNISDFYGDSGQAALVIFNNLEAHIDIFVMSCRVMGRKLENYIIDFVEQDLISKGFTNIHAKYVYTNKSLPVANFYDGLGYLCISDDDAEKQYTVDLEKRADRDYNVYEQL